MTTLEKTKIESKSHAQSESHGIKVANAPCSWGALEFEAARNDKLFERVLNEMATAGFIGTELGDWGFMPTAPEKLKAELAKRKLEMLAAFVPVNLSSSCADSLKEGAERAVRAAQLLAAVAQKPFIVLSDDNCRDKVRHKNAGRITRHQGMNDEQWGNFIRGTHFVAREVLRRTGVRTVFHHHCAGFIETPEEIERFVSATDPDLIGLCFDTGHYLFGAGGQGDALSALKKWAGRIEHVHYKDCQPRIANLAKAREYDYFQSVRAGIFCELGTGSVPFADLTAELKRLNYRGWIVVEQDVLPGMGTPFESAVRNRAYLKSIGL